MLEGESSESLVNQLRLFRERALPDLSNNIKCGNSLVTPRFYDTQQLSLLNDEDYFRINVFDWTAAFSEVFSGSKPGFDAVIGNPPYIFGEYHDSSVKRYFQATYGVAEDQYDTYWLFIERGIELTAEGGRFGMIVPDALLARDVARSVRKLLLRAGLDDVYHCGMVFQAGVSAVVVVAGVGTQSKMLTSRVRRGNEAIMEHSCSRVRFESDENSRLLVHASDTEVHILAKAQSASQRSRPPFSISRGEEIGTASVHMTGEVAILIGRDIGRYHLKEPTRFVNAATKAPTLYESPKLVVVKTGSRCIAALDRTSQVTMQSVYNLHVEDDVLRPETLLAVLNSTFVRFFVFKTFTAYKLLFPQMNQSTLTSIPVPFPDDVQQSQLKSLVESMMSLQARAKSAIGGHERSIVQTQLAATDRRIDRLVYGLYGLTDDEIAVVEAAL